ncbi:MAG TPA: hypothetical protein VE842_02050 [Pyrinomonadaceae bacterium]|jgi:hypothetical protein|nr:hypothetical protein [Pyrinomonadaceae bacterium]
MLDVQIEPESIRIGARFIVSFKRTLRIPDDGKAHKTPPNFGVLPVYRVEDYAERVPGRWREEGGAFIPMYQREALYIRFENEAPWQPHAAKITIGGINAVSGEPDAAAALRAGRQDYLVCPPQLWLDGINTGRGTIRQFVAMPLGLGYTVEASLTGGEEVGGIQITVFAPKQGIFPDEPPPTQTAAAPRPSALPRQRSAATAQMGLGAGGVIKEKILPDPHGPDTWDQNNFGRVSVHILNNAQFREITGTEPPPTSVDQQTYAEHKFPWFHLYGEITQGDVAPSERLAQAQTIAERDAEREAGEAGDERAPVS